MAEIAIDLDKMIESGNVMTAGDYYFYKGLKEGNVYIDAEIDENTVSYVIYPLLHMEKDNNIKSIDVYINSRGGDPYVAMNIVSTLEHMTKPITIHILGEAASAGGFIAMSKGDHIKTVCSKYSVGLIHPGGIYLEGNSAEARDTHDFIQKYDDVVIKNFILSHTSMTEEKYEEIKRREYWMTAEDMKELNIVDEII